ncbi:MAG: aminotransferase class IV [Planctomycetota bacterium]|nr:aminotransferase class IV [Planctomycetota bacterium]MDI6786769.1 aminotransferase class IV [Planctomycetota bacterium]
MSDFIWLNGQYLRRNEAKISLYESGLLYGYGVFETIMIHSQKPFKLEEHYERMKNSARHIGMSVHISHKSLQAVINRLTLLNNIQKGSARIVVSSFEEPSKAMRFSSSASPPAKSDSDTPKESTKITKYRPSMILVETGPIVPEYEKCRQTGINVLVYPYNRSSETAYYRHKTLAYMENILARRMAKKHKAMEAVFINTDNYVMEGTRSSIFIVKDHKVFTPAIGSNILSGITRNIVIGLCTKNIFKVRERLLAREDLFSADEVFVTSTLMEVMPVTRFKILETSESRKEIVIKDGEVGPITRRLQQSYSDLLVNSI